MATVFSDLLMHLRVSDSAKEQILMESMQQSRSLDQLKDNTGK